MKKLCVFCGSKVGTNPQNEKDAIWLGQQLVELNWGLVYGGAGVGLMNSLATACLEKGGKVWGVIPESLKEVEYAHSGLTEMIVTSTMHQRKQRMYSLSDAFVALPGGYGTMDELFEILTWCQLGFHDKPILVYNGDGFFDHLIHMVEKMHECGFVSETNRQLIQVVENREKLTDFLKVD